MRRLGGGGGNSDDSSSGRIESSGVGMQFAADTLRHLTLQTSMSTHEMICLAIMDQARPHNIHHIHNHQVHVAGFE